MNLIRLRAVSAQTHGVFTSTTALDAGITRARFNRLRRAGAFTHVCGHGYMLGSRAPTVEQRAVAAHLTWPDAIVCLRTAAALHGLPIADDGATHVLVPDGRVSTKGLVAHHWSVRPVQVEHTESWRVTDRLTTLADVLGRLPVTEAWGRLAWMATRDLITASDLQAQLGERKQMYGVVRLRAMANALACGAVSLAEVELHRFLKKEEFTGWAGNEKIFENGRIVARADILFIAEGLIIEYDGRLAHPEEREADDRRRAKRLRRLGYRIIRVRWERLIFTPDALAREIREVLNDLQACPTA